MRNRPHEREYPEYYARYVARVPDGDVVASLAVQVEATIRLLEGVPESMAGHRYAPDKWTLGQVVGHVADTERVMAYRALRFARGDATPLAGFDENEWATGAGHTDRTLGSLIEEFRAVRVATLALLTWLPPEAWDRAGLANDLPTSVRGLAWIIAGHELHHRAILLDRYLGAGAGQARNEGDGGRGNAG